MAINLAGVVDLGADVAGGHVHVHGPLPIAGHAVVPSCGIRAVTLAVGAESCITRRSCHGHPLEGISGRSQSMLEPKQVSKEPVVVSDAEAEALVLEEEVLSEEVSP